MDLVTGIHDLSQAGSLSVPETLLYASLAELGIAEKILTTESVPQDVQSFITEVAIPEAISNFELGLAETPANEARSLIGTFHVLEAKAMALLGSPTATDLSTLQGTVSGGTDSFVFNTDFGNTAALNHQDVLAFDQNVFGVQQAADHTHDITTAVQQVLDHAHDATVGFVAPDVGGVNVADLHSHSFHFV